MATRVNGRPRARATVRRPQQRGAECVYLGKKIGIVVVDRAGARRLHELAENYALVTDTGMRDIQLVRRGAEQRRASSAEARAVYDAWTAGRGGADRVWVAMPVPDSGDACGEMQAIMYYGVLAGWQGHRHHVFESPGPILRRSAGGIYFVQRGRSRYRVTTRGIVG